MKDLHKKIRQAQVEAGEKAVIEGLKEKGLLPLGEKLPEQLLPKSIKPKPHFYAVCLPGLQEIARELGYNLVVHGSMNRDFDLIVIPWVSAPAPHLKLLAEFSIFLGVPVQEDEAHYLFTTLPGGRASYVINLDRGGKYNGYVDAQYYLDISITPLPQ